MVLAVRVGPGARQRLDDAQVLVQVHGRVQRRGAFCGQCIGIGPGFDQQPDDRGLVAVHRRHVDRVLAEEVAHLKAGPGLKAGAHIRDVRLLEELLRVPLAAVGPHPGILAADAQGCHQEQQRPLPGRRQAQGREAGYGQIHHRFAACIRVVAMAGLAGL